MLSVGELKPHHTFLAGGGALGDLIRAHDWDSSPLGPPETWPQSLRSALSICLRSSFPTAIYWGPELRLLYNDAWAPIPAERHPWALGRPGAEVWADIWDVVGPQFEDVYETGEGYSVFDQMLPMVRGGVRQETYWNYSFTAIRGEDGAVVGVFNQGNETTTAVLARRHAEAEIARLGRWFAQAPGAIAILRGSTHIFELANPAYKDLVGRSDIEGKMVAEALPEVVAQGFVERLDRVLETGEPYVGRAAPVVLQRNEGVPPEERFVDFVFQPLNDTSGVPSGIFVQVTDVTDAARAEVALRASEEFSRSVVQSSGDCIMVVELDGSVQFVNDSGLALMEIDDASDVLGTPWINRWSDDSLAEVDAAMRLAMSGGVGRFSAFGPTAKGAPKWWDVVVSPIHGDGGGTVRLVTIARDVTEQKKAEEGRQLLLGELDHRVKNLFAIASGMVSMTARSATSVEELAGVLRGRLNALAKAHELIRSEIISETGGSQNAGLQLLLTEILAPHVNPAGDDRLTLEGPEIVLASRSATSLALIFHELATNAAKYGALSSEDGRLDIRWAIGCDRLRLTWRERLPSGSISAPKTHGFGSRLAHSSATAQLGGEILYEWCPDGVDIALNLPLEHLTTGSHTNDFGSGR